MTEVTIEIGEVHEFMLDKMLDDEQDQEEFLENTMRQMIYNMHEESEGQ